MNRKTQAAVRKLKDADGQLSLGAAGDSGRPRHNHELPGGGSGGHARHRRDTLIRSPSAISRAATWSSTGRECGYSAIPSSQKPYVLFYTTKRVGGGVQDFDAIKLIKFGTA